jgi:large subunit ribosomal protein L25
MDTIKLNVIDRTETGNGPARRLRVAGRVPAVVYGKGESTAISIATDEFREAMLQGHNIVMQLDFGKKGKSAARYAVVKEFQLHPIRRTLLHVDLHEVDLKEEIEATVAIEIHGEPAGLKDEGIVDWEHREVVVRALPNEVPASIQLDISALQIGQHLSVAALAAPKGVTIVDDPDTIIVTVIPPRVQEEVAGEEVTEPEVIGGTKTEE